MSKEVSKTPPLSLIITAEHLSGKTRRADQVLALAEGLPSRSQLKIWFEEGRVTRAGEALTPNAKLRLGDEIVLAPPPFRQLSLKPHKLDLDILFEDEYLIVLNKPRGLSMHPGAGRDDEVTLVHGLLAHSSRLSEGSDEFRPGIVHRLDKDTEGLVVIAKSNEVHAHLSHQFSERKIDRRYWALCWGEPPSQLLIDAPIGRDKTQRQKMRIREDGKPSRTHLKRLKILPQGFSWIECKLETGRTHQIRVHCTSKGFPLLKDPLYGRARAMRGLDERQQLIYEALEGQALVAFELGFDHPVTGKKHSYTVEPPRWLRVLAQI
jgi:23S rRNA pseudouridine1911/1915/1917 synthase